MIVKTEPTSTPSRTGRRLWRGFTTALAAAAAFALVSQIYFGIRTRAEAETRLQQATEQSAVLAVDVTHPQSGALTQEVVLPGSMEAFVDSPIYARTSGYLKHWYFDIGARIKQGAVLCGLLTGPKAVNGMGFGTVLTQSG
jgi:multidrug efflux pump subunit AcrA (membrane-fusion protein)